MSKRLPEYLPCKYSMTMAESVGEMAPLKNIISEMFPIVPYPPDLSAPMDIPLCEKLPTSPLTILSPLHEMKEELSLKKD